MEQFRRNDGSNEQYFIDSNLPICPLCGLAEPRWMIGDRLEHTKRVTLFRCSRCGGILTVEREHLWADGTAGEVPVGLGANGIPAKILSADHRSKAVDFVGRILPLGDLKRMASGHAAAPETAPKESPVPAAPTSSAERPAAPQAESFFARSPDLFEDGGSLSAPVRSVPERQPVHAAANPYTSHGATGTHPGYAAANPYTGHGATGTHPGYTATNPYGAMSRETVSPYHPTYTPFKEPAARNHHRV